MEGVTGERCTVDGFLAKLMMLMMLYFCLYRLRIRTPYLIVRFGFY